MKVKIFSINFFFNGEEYILQTFKMFSLDDLIKFFNYKQNLIIIEYNGKITPPQLWSARTLKMNDKIELITIVGGG